MIVKMHELRNVYAPRGFNGKAYVKDYENYVTLESYGKVVAIMHRSVFKDYRGIIVIGENDYSQTTHRHVKEFFKQFGNKVYDSRNKMWEEYFLCEDLAWEAGWYENKDFEC